MEYFCCMADVDNFKIYNDCLSYKGADEKLKEISTLFKKFEKDYQRIADNGLDKAPIKACDTIHVSGDEYIFVYGHYKKDGADGRRALLKAMKQ